MKLPPARFRLLRGHTPQSTSILFSTTTKSFICRRGSCRKPQWVFQRFLSAFCIRAGPVCAAAVAMNVDLWLHAVNSPEALSAALRKFTSMSPELCLGIECDIRCCSRTSRPVLSHDPLHHRHSTDDAGPTESPMPLSGLCEGLHSVASTTEGRRCVLKLDFKDQLAAVLVAEGKVPEVQRLASQSAIQLWFNADVIACDATDTKSFRTSFPNPVRLAQLAVVSFPVVSFGFHRPANATLPYHEGDADAVEEFYSAALPLRSEGQAEKIVAVTLPLRLSLFRESENAQGAVRAMLTSAADALRRCHGGSQSRDRRVFLTVWRGREETIDDADVAWLAATFGGCTVDRD